MINAIKFVFVLSLLGLAGCLKTRTDIKDLDNKKNVQEQVTLLQRSTADQNSRFSEIDNDIRELNGRIETLENKMNLSSREREVGSKSTEEQLQEMNRKISILQEEMLKLEGQISNLSSDARASVKASAAESKKDVFSQAEDLFASKEWAKAALAYNQYRDTSPKGKHVAAATYKMGVCFEELGKKDEARAFYDEVIEKFPKSDEAKKAKIRSKRIKK